MNIVINVPDIFILTLVIIYFVVFLKSDVDNKIFKFLVFLIVLICLWFKDKVNWLFVFSMIVIVLFISKIRRR